MILCALSDKTVQTDICFIFYLYIFYNIEYVGNNTWKKDGCNTTQINDTVVECSCDHMTPFAVLLVSNDPFIQTIAKRLR